MSVKRLKSYTTNAIYKELGLDSFAINYGQNAKDSGPISEAEKKINSYVESESGEILKKYHEPLEQASDKKQKILNQLNNIENELNEIRDDSIAKIERQIVSQAEIDDLAKKGKNAEKQIKNFLAKERIGTPKPNTPHPDWKWIFILIPFLILGIEAYLNSSLLGSQSLNVKSAQVMVFGIAILNLGLGWIVGSYLWPETNKNIELSKKIPTYLLISISLILVFAINGFFGHYRQAVNDASVNSRVITHFESKGYSMDPEFIVRNFVVQEKPYIKDGMTLLVLDSGEVVNRKSIGRTVLERTSKNFINIGEVESLQLFALGILCFFGVCVDFYKFSGSYPGYSRLIYEADGPAQERQKLSKQTMKLKEKSDSDFVTQINKLEVTYKKNIDEYGILWNSIEQSLSQFNTEAKSLTGSARASMEEFILEFYHHAPESINKLSPKKLKFEFYDSIEENENWEKDFVAASKHFTNLKELFRFENGNPVGFINKKDKIEFFNNRIELFAKTKSDYRERISSNQEINNIVQFDLGKHRELYLVR